jgi:hypothetical protein
VRVLSLKGVGIGVKSGGKAAACEFRYCLGMEFGNHAEPENSKTNCFFAVHICSPKTSVCGRYIVKQNHAYRNGSGKGVLMKISCLLS